MTTNEVPAPAVSLSGEMLCDGCDTQQPNVSATDDGRALLCEQCHLNARETASDYADWYDQDR